MNDLSKLHKALTELQRKCWHENIEFDSEGYGTCSKCLATDFFNGVIGVQKVSFVNPSPTTNPTDYWDVLQYVKGHEKWIKFLISIPIPNNNCFYTTEVLLDPQKGCEAIADFFVPGWREK